MTETFYLEVELTSREEPVEIAVEVEAHWENDGIGAYEYWGHKCYDRGTNYVEIDSTDYDKTGFSPEDIKEIDAAIERAMDGWCDKMAEDDCDNYSDEPDYEPTADW